MVEVVLGFVRRRARLARAWRVRDYFQARSFAAAEVEFAHYAQQHLGRCRSCGELDVEHATDVWHEHDLAGHEDGLDWYRFRVHCRACGDDSTYFAPRPEPHHYPRDLRARAVVLVGWLGRWWGGLEAR